MNSVRSVGGRLASLSLGVGAGVATAILPFETIGIGLGLVLLVVTVVVPVAVVGLSLALGPIDLGFLTGGFKGLFPQLGGLDMNGIRLVSITASFAVLLLTQRHAWRMATRPPLRWFGLFLAYTVVSLTYSPDRTDGVKFALKLAYPLMLGLVVAAGGFNRATLKRLADVMLISAALVLCLIAPISAILGGYEVDSAGQLRIQGPGLQENPFAFYSLLVLVACQIRLHTRRDWRYLGLASVAGVWVVLTHTRIALAAMLPAIVFVEWAFARGKWRVGAPAVALVFGSALVALLLPHFLQVTFYGHVPSINTILRASPAELATMINLKGREIFWALAWTVFIRHPLTGGGAGATTHVLTRELPLDFGQIVAPSTAGLVVHNEYLRVAAEFGVIGLALVVFAFVALARWALRAGAADPLARECYVASATYVMILGIIAVTDNPLDFYAPMMQYIFFFICAGLALGHLARPAMPEYSHEGVAPEAPRSSRGTTPY